MSVSDYNEDDGGGQRNRVTQALGQDEVSKFLMAKMTEMSQWDDAENHARANMCLDASKTKLDLTDP